MCVVTMATTYWAEISDQPVAGSQKTASVILCMSQFTREWPKLAVTSLYKWTEPGRICPKAYSETLHIVEKQFSEPGI